VELLTVILILAVLIALLLPALNSAIRTARTAAVGSEINQLAQALAAFKAKYGIYPPSRVYLAEDGNFGGGATTAIATGDITYQQLALRTVQALRTMFPRANFSTSGVVWPHGGKFWYDFNGNGVFDQNPYVLQGHECLVFFLGGIPQATGSNFGMTGFGKDPSNPFSNNISSDPNNANNPNPMYSGNRQAPFFEFAPNRLALDPNQVQFYGSGWSSPGYLDSLGNTPPNGGPGQTINFFAYFSSYGNNGYDPNDVNFAPLQYLSPALPNPQVEVDASQSPFALAFRVNFQVTGGCSSAPPNPYTSTTTFPPGGVATYLNPQSFQLISSGVDGLYGVGGQYSPDSAGASLPIDHSTPSPYNTSDTSIRGRENDNITNFHNGRLQ
jgi:general secretion pathway protein G